MRRTDVRGLYFDNYDQRKRCVGLRRFNAYSAFGPQTQKRAATAALFLTLNVTELRQSQLSCGGPVLRHLQGLSAEADQRLVQERLRAKHYQEQRQTAFQDYRSP